MKMYGWFDADIYDGDMGLYLMALNIQRQRFACSDGNKVKKLLKSKWWTELAEGVSLFHLSWREPHLYCEVPTNLSHKAHSFEKLIETIAVKMQYVKLQCLPVLKSVWVSFLLQETTNWNVISNYLPHCGSKIVGIYRVSKWHLPHKVHKWRTKNVLKRIVKANLLCARGSTHFCALGTNKLCLEGK